MNEHIAALNLARPSAGDCRDNAICFYEGDKVAVFDFSQKRYISKMRKLAQDYPDDVQIVTENNDGTIVGRVPVSWVKINPKRKGREFSEEERAALRDRLAKARQK